MTGAIHTSTPYLVVVMAGAPIPRVLRAEWSHGWDLGMAEASVYVYDFDQSGDYERKAPITIIAGGGTNNIQRFTGVYLEQRRTLFPQVTQLVCRGRLYWADKWKYTDSLVDDTGDEGLYFEDWFPTGGTDEAIVRGALAKVPELAGLDASLIGGTGTTLGTQAPESFLWPSKMSALAFCQMFDQVCLGYRLYDTAGGSIRRSAIQGWPGDHTPAHTFTEGVDILDANSGRGILTLVNAVEVSGVDYGDGAGPVHWLEVSENPFQTPDAPVPYPFSSALIEREAAAEPGDGLSAEDVANYYLTELNRERVELTMTTPLDIPLQPGETYLVRGNTAGEPKRLGIGEVLWAKRVDGSCSADGGFRQTITFIGGGLGLGSGEPGGADPGTVPNPPPPWDGLTEPLTQIDLEWIYDLTGDVVIAG